MALGRSLSFPSSHFLQILNEQVRLDGGLQGPFSVLKFCAIGKATKKAMSSLNRVEQRTSKVREKYS